MTKKKLVIILGMHRSGTSAFARALKVMNINLGDKLMPAEPGANDKGFWEDLDIYDLNENILSALSSSWHHLGPVSQDDLTKLEQLGFFEQAKNLLREKISNTEVFGFKDPRLARLLPFWKRVFSELQIEVDYIITLRHPLSVTQSLLRRDGFPIEKGMFMWLDHMMACLIETQGEHRILAHYDMLLDDPETVLHALANFLGLEINQTELARFKEEFLDKNLRHYVFSYQDLETETGDNVFLIIRDLYKQLSQCNLDSFCLDSPILLQTISMWQGVIKSQNSSWHLINILTSQNNHLSTQVVQLNQSLAERDAQIAQLTQTLTEIHNSKTWRVALFLRKTLEMIAPRGSKREDVIRKTLSLLQSLYSNFQKSK